MKNPKDYSFKSLIFEKKASKNNDNNLPISLSQAKKVKLAKKSKHNRNN